jgi:predicted helicase
LKQNKLGTIPWERLYPDNKNNWLNISNSDYGTLVPLTAKTKGENAVFYECFPGVSTNRTDWLFDFSKQELIKKVKFFIKKYNESIEVKKIDNSIKWSESLENNFKRLKKAKYTDKYIITACFRPFIKKYYYSDPLLSDRLTRNHISSIQFDNIFIIFSGKGHNQIFSVLASKYIPELHNIENGQCIPMYIINKSKQKTSNVTDWALKTFTGHYQDVTITKKDIFYYVYAVLHNPNYILKYGDDLRRNTPHIPYYKDFHTWAAWGKSLIALHTSYENVKEYPLKMSIIKSDAEYKQFKYDKTSGQIIIDDTTINGIPSDVLNYKLSQRSPVEWIIDQYKPKKIDDTTIAENFNTNNYKQNKNEIISLVKKIVTVSLETVKILDLMKNTGNIE